MRRTAARCGLHCCASVGNTGKVRRSVAYVVGWPAAHTLLHTDRCHRVSNTPCQHFRSLRATQVYRRRRFETVIPVCPFDGSAHIWSTK
jgi:hypothetical protein